MLLNITGGGVKALHKDMAIKHLMTDIDVEKDQAVEELVPHILSKLKGEQ